MATTNFVLLATRDADLGLVDMARAKQEAQLLADELRQPVSIRHHITDRVLSIARPKRRRGGCVSRASR